MYKSLIIAAGIALVASGSSIAKGVPTNPVSGTPGNSGAAHDVLPGAQKNCHGDIFSTARKGARGPVADDRPRGQDRAALNGTLFLVGSIIGILPEETCGDLVTP